eukprot:1846764-Amphidinium_carterae.1
MPWKLRNEAWTTGGAIHRPARQDRSRPRSWLCCSVLARKSRVSSMLRKLQRYFACPHFPSGALQPRLRLALACPIMPTCGVMS